MRRVGAMGIALVLVGVAFVLHRGVWRADVARLASAVGIPSGLAAKVSGEPRLPPVASAPRTGAERGEDWTRRFLERLRDREAGALFYDDLRADGPAAAAALGDFLTDFEPLARLRDGDVRAELAPPEVGLRGPALALLGVMLIHPRADPASREAAARSLARVVEAPLPALSSNEAMELQLREKGRALARLLRSDRAAADASLVRIEDPALRRRVEIETRDALVAGGMPRVEANAALRALAGV